MQQINVFISYAHADKLWCEQLYSNLKRLEFERKAIIWFDEKLRCGDSFEEVIKKKVEQSEVILLIVTSNFLASEYCYINELSLALTRHKGGACRVIPIIFENCDWKSSWLGGIESLPKGGLPVSDADNVKNAIVDVVAGIASEIDTLISDLVLPDPELAIFTNEDLCEILENIERSILVIKKAISKFPDPSTSKLIELDELETKRETYQTELAIRGVDKS